MSFRVITVTGFMTDKPVLSMKRVLAFSKIELPLAFPGEKTASTGLHLNKSSKKNVMQGGCHQRKTSDSEAERNRSPSP